MTMPMNDDDDDDEYDDDDDDDDDDDNAYHGGTYLIRPSEQCQYSTQAPFCLDNTCLPHFPSTTFHS